MVQKMDEKSQQLAYESYFHRQKITSLKGEMERITLTMLDLSNASKTIESLTTADSLVPIGGNAFIETKISSDQIIVPIGGGYSLKMDRKSAKEEIDRRVESTKKIIEKLQAEYEKSMSTLNQVESEIRAMQGKKQ